MFVRIGMRIRTLFLIVTTSLAALVFAGCGPRASQPGASTVDTNRQSFEVRGVVKKLMPNGRTAEISHEEIPNYMEAMTMDFEVKDRKELEGLKAGDYIAFRLVVTKDDGWMENVRKLPVPAPTNASQTISVNNTNDSNGPVTFRRAPIVEPLEIGQMLPDYKFTNHLGKAFTLGQFKGRALGLTFIFTRCPFPTFCPRMSQHFEKAQAGLLARSGAATNWSLLSISFDPAWDTPERLKKYSEPYHLDPRHWQFATGDLWTIDGLTEQFGMTFYRATPTSLPEHNLRTVVVDARGRIHKVYVGNEWTPDEFVEEIIKAAAVK